MRALDLALFNWMSAGFTPNAMLLRCAMAAALWGGWASCFVLAWAAWNRRPQRPYLLATLALGVLAGVLAHAIAASLELPRPFMLGLSPGYISHGTRGSLPSAHASVIFTLAAVLLMRPALRREGWAMLAIGLVTGWGRIYVGVHFPFDVLAGASLAVSLALLFEGSRRIFFSQARLAVTGPRPPPLRLDGDAP